MLDDLLLVGQPRLIEPAVCHNQPLVQRLLVPGPPERPLQFIDGRELTTLDEETWCTLRGDRLAMKCRDGGIGRRARLRA